MPASSREPDRAPRRGALAVEPVLDFVHFGTVSGSAVSLRRAMAQRVPLAALNVLPLARDVTLLPARLRALAEARRSGRGVPWVRTRAWSVAVERRLRQAGVGRGRPVLFVGTMTPVVLPEGVRYAVYTDRVAREGAAMGGHLASRFSAGWLTREESFLRNAARVYTMGPTTVEWLQRAYGIPRDRIRAVGAGPNAPLTGPIAARTCRRLLFVGLEWERKGGPQLLEAFAQVRRCHPHLELLVVGATPRGPLPPGVRVCGRTVHRAMDDFYSQADALVLPTHRDAVPICLIEAMWKALPCIVTTVGNQRWIVQEAGLVVEPGDVPGLVTALDRLVREYPTFAARAARRSEVVRQTFRWDRVADQILGDLLQPD